MRRRLAAAVVCTGLVALFAISDVAGQPASVCATVKIEILQRLTFERVAFDARLVITNDLPDEALNDFGVDLDIRTSDGEPAADLFFVRVDRKDHVDAVDGTGTLPAGARAEVHWLIIPSAGAGGVEEIGQFYTVGGQVTFSVTGGDRSLELFPAPIQVRPQPLLQVDYFLPREVEADDPFTETVEAPVPFSLGVRVHNEGHGTAGNLRISSGQPQIVENVQGLLIAFRLLGTAVNGSAVEPTLDAAFGTIAPSECGVATWEMITTLSGRFVEFDASYTHAPELGGDLTSLIQGSSSNGLVREMLVDLPGRDTAPDFLADTDDDGEFVPDEIFDSDCDNFPVNPVNATATGNPSSGEDVTLTIATIPGWAFARVADPADGLIALVEVVRSDGKVLKPENFWVSRVKDEDIPTLYHYFVNVIDFDSTGTYTVRYAQPELDTLAPSTTLVFQEPFFGSDPTFITPTTQILFTATDDISGVDAIEYRLDGAPDYLPGLPFTITDPGPHQIVFRSTDRAGNVESDRVVQVVVDPDAPALDPLVAQPDTITPTAPPGEAVAREAALSVTATDAIADLSGLLEVASGTGPNFDTLQLVRTIAFTLQSGVPRQILWDGANDSAVPVPEGTYTLRASATDPLGHSSTASTIVDVTEFVDQDVPAAAPDADQQVPDLVGTRLVWEDNRAGDWDVLLLDLSGGLASNLTAGQTSEQRNPATDGAYIVWQDRRNGNWDIFLHEIGAGVTSPFATDLADQEQPVVSAPWVVWQEDRGGRWDVVARNIDTGETVEVSVGDTGAHDQIRPSISGTWIAFEDYRFGLADIFLYDLATRSEQRITDDVESQTQPTIDGDRLVWVDRRDGNRELYLYEIADDVERRLTYTPTDETHPDLRGSRVGYVDFLAGLGDPAVSVLNVDTRRSLRITSDPARQERPAVDGNRIVWQDDRTGRWQIRSTEVALDALPIAKQVGPGLNLIGLTDSVVAAFPTAFALLGEWTASGVTELRRYDPVEGTFRVARLAPGGGAVEGDDFPIVVGDAIASSATADDSLALAAPTLCAGVSVTPGPNYVSLPCTPPGLRASDWLKELGLSKISSIVRYDVPSGRWQALAVDGPTLVGSDFEIVVGEGYLIYAREAAGPFLP
ncbi:MAG: hypothetical protein GY716_08045 [bacterium]|nr:hypothetical protein [bacterium]